MKPDARGWWWHEKLWIRLTALGFDAMHMFFSVRAWLSRGHWLAYDPTSRLWNFYVWLAGESYLYDELKRGDIPENVRIGGVWR